MPKKSMEVLTESMFYVLMPFKAGPCAAPTSQTISRSGPEDACVWDLRRFIRSWVSLKRSTIYGKSRWTEGAGTYLITEKGAGAYHSELKRLQFCVADALAEQQKEVLDNA